MAADELTFNPDRRLLNPHFELYKLSVRDEVAGPSSVPLAEPFTPSIGADLLTWGWREARARARWNHLSVGSQGNLIWIDSAGRVWSWEPSGSSENSAPATLVLRLPPGDSSPTEYPSAVELIASSSLWLLSPGDGRIFLASLTKGGGALLATMPFLAPSDSSDALPTPFKLHHAAAAEAGDSARAVLSVAKTSAVELSKGRHATHSYELFVVEVSLASISDGRLGLSTIASLRSEDAPAFVWKVAERWLIGSTKPFERLSAPADEVKSPPVAKTEAAAEESAVEPPKLYSWTQTPTSVSISVPLPSSFNASSIAVLYTFTALHLRFLSLPQILSLSEEALLERLKRRFEPSSTLWGKIDPSTSTWTWDKSVSEGGTMGLLTLELEKASGEEGGRWPSVFAHEHDDGVHESVDPSEAVAMLERLEKYTMDEGVAGSEFAGGGVSSLAAGERDPEIDDVGAAGSEGDSAGMVLTWLDIGGGKTEVTTPHPSLPIQVIASPLPLASSCALDASLVIKSDVDGLVFSPPSDDGFTWRHLSTLPALAFVIASKRDARFVRHIHSRKTGKRAALVFESATAGTSARAGRSAAGAGNLYVYHGTEPAEGQKVKTARQEVVRIGGPDSGAVMGVAGVEREDGSVDVVCLCEKELVVVKSIL